MSQFDPLEPLASAATSLQLVLPSMVVTESQKVGTGIVLMADPFHTRPAAVAMPVPKKIAGTERTEGGTFGGLDMIDGEELVHVQRDVTEVSPTHRQSRGVLFVSNFRLAFQADSASRVRSRVCKDYFTKTVLIGRSGDRTVHDFETRKTTG